MKYTPEITAEILKDWNLGEGLSILELSQKYEAPKRSLITKLGNLGVYKAKEYRNKQGEVPVKKSEYIERIAVLLDVTPDRLDSLEKSNKWILALIQTKLENTNLQNIIEQPLTPDELASLRLRVPPPMTSGEVDPLKMGPAVLDCGGISDLQPTGKISGVVINETLEGHCKWHEEDEKHIPALWPIAAT